MLHILMKSPFFIDMKVIFRFLKPKDSFLAIQDGVLIALKKNLFLHRITCLVNKLYVLKEDLLARGLNKKTSERFNIINYIGFVKLTEANQRQITWK